jgi:hypothetical protein
MSPDQSNGRGRAGSAAAIAIPAVLAMTALVTWPQSRLLTSAFIQHVDPYFSAWRLAWIAHALRTDAHRLFDANIFYPSAATLAYSDATLLEGALAAPLLWAGLSPVLVYNVMLLAGFAGSGLAMFVLARHLTGRIVPALVAAAVFTMAPYRIEHVMHLELQWAMWMPLTFWALHRAVEARSWRFAVLSGVFIWFQVLSSVYYGVFLAMATAVFAPLLLLLSGRVALGALPRLAAGAALAAALTIPYARPYIQNASELGERPREEVMTYSATPINYLAAVSENRVWGWTGNRWGKDERRLFPGLVAIVLAGCAFLRRPRRLAWLYFALALVTIDLSLGLNGFVYSALYDRVQTLHGLRAPARFAIVALCFIAALAAMGVRALQDRLRAHEVPPLAASLVVLLLAIVEYMNAPLGLTPVAAPDRTAYDVYRAIRSQGPGVVIELPLPTLLTLPGEDATYAFWSASHWNPLVNGYSGYYPNVYAETVVRMATFPDEESMARLKRLRVRYIVVHRRFFAREDQYAALLLNMAEQSGLRPFGTYRDPSGGEARLFLLIDAEG